MGRVASRTEPVREPVIEDLPGKTAPVGDGEVRRLLPNRARRAVGPWCFVDHFGPDRTPPDARGVGPHPHTGLQTVTWLIEGAMRHRDSLGSAQIIQPGQLNWMTAGHGIAHAEEHLYPPAPRMHGVQLWVAMPDAHRHGEPAFDHYATLPTLALSGGEVVVLAGTVGDATHAVRSFSPLVGMEIRVRDGAMRIPLDPAFEHAVFVTVGAARAAGEELEVGTLRYLGMGRDHLDIHAPAGSRLMVVGGEPLDEPLLLAWNFVARTEDEVRTATTDWNDGDRFGTVNSGLPRIPAPTW